MNPAQHEKVMVIPCSGIGKALGSISREATYEVVENIKKGVTETVCLSLLVIGDEESLRLVRDNKCITVDGCPLQCAGKNVRLVGGSLAATFRVVDALKENRNLKPRTVTFLDHDGEKLAEVLAQQIAKKVDEILKK